jgi:hypothetical protein
VVPSLKLGQRQTQGGSRKPDLFSNLIDVPAPREWITMASGPSARRRGLRVTPTRSHCGTEPELPGHAGKIRRNDWPSRDTQSTAYLRYSCQKKHFLPSPSDLSWPAQAGRDCTQAGRRSTSSESPVTCASCSSPVPAAQACQWMSQDSELELGEMPLTQARRGACHRPGPLAGRLQS